MFCIYINILLIPGNIFWTVQIPSSIVIASSQGHNITTLYTTPDITAFHSARHIAVYRDFIYFIQDEKFEQGFDGRFYRMKKDGSDVPMVQQINNSTCPVYIYENENRTSKHY